MRILFVTQCYSPAVGGTESYVQHVAEELARGYGDVVTVFSTDGYSVEGFSDPDARRMPLGRGTIGGVEVQRFAVARRASRLLRWPQAVAYRLHAPWNDRLRAMYQGPVVPGLRDAIRRTPADIVSASSFPLLHMYTALSAARASGRPCVLHGAVHPEDQWGFDRAMIGEAVRRAQAYVGNTEYEARWVAEQGVPPARIHVAPPGVEAAVFEKPSADEARALLGLRPAPVVGFIGQLGGHKGVDTLLEAMRVVWTGQPAAQLLIAGARTQFSRWLERALAYLPPAQRAQVVLRYDFAEAEKPVLYNAIDLLASPSGYESFGITFLEAWAAGKPVIGCRRGAVPSVVADGEDGILVGYRDVGQLAEAILLLLNRQDTARRMGDTGRKKVRERYTWRRTAEAYRHALEAAARTREVQ